MRDVDESPGARPPSTTIRPDIITATARETPTGRCSTVRAVVAVVAVVVAARDGAADDEDVPACRSVLTAEGAAVDPAEQAVAAAATSAATTAFIA
jgi:hypothetical protein